MTKYPSDLVHYKALIKKLLITFIVHLSEACIIKRMVLLKLKPEFHSRISLAAGEVYSLHRISEISVSGGCLFTSKC